MAVKSKWVDARQTVLDSAIAEFARKGYSGTSIDDILSATHLSRPTLYYYFQSKSGLFRAIVDYAFDECLGLMQDAASQANTCQARLCAVAEALFGFAQSHHSLMRIVLSAVFAAPEEIPPECIDLQKRRRNFEFVLGIIQDGLRSGELDSTFEATELANGIFGAISHQTRMHLLDPQGQLDRQRAERVVTLFLNGARKLKRKS